MIKVEKFKINIHIFFPLFKLRKMNNITNIIKFYFENHKESNIIIKIIDNKLKFKINLKYKMVINKYK